MLWFPLIGTQRRVYADLLRQLKMRTQDDMPAWEVYPKEIRELAEKVTAIVIERLRWPKTSIFIPDDPADIPFWDRTGHLVDVETMLELAKQLGTKCEDVDWDIFWQDLPRLTYGKAIERINDMMAGQGGAW